MFPISKFFKQLLSIFRFYELCTVRIVSTMAQTLNDSKHVYCDVWLTSLFEVYSFLLQCFRYCLPFFFSPSYKSVVKSLLINLLQQVSKLVQICCLLYEHASSVIIFLELKKIFLSVLIFFFKKVYIKLNKYIKLSTLATFKNLRNTTTF